MLDSERCCSGATLYATTASPVGELLLVSREGALTGLYMVEGPRPKRVPKDWSRTEEPFAPVVEQLGQYFAGLRTSFDLRLEMLGTAFQRQVWEGLRDIPHGQTESYGALAARLGPAVSPRAVGTANGQNPISIVVPCHRVIGADGSLVGYGGGLGRKRVLLDLEAGVLTLG